MLLVYLFSLVLANQESQEELSKTIGACWLMTIKEINVSQDQMNAIIASTNSTNKTAIYHKVQMAMIFRCLDAIDNTRAVEYLQSSENNYFQVVPDFKFTELHQLDLELTESEKTMLKVIKELEKGMSDLQKAKLLEKKQKLAAQVQEKWGDAVTAPRKPQQIIESPGYGQYILFATVMTVVFSGGYFFIRFLQQGDQKKTKKVK